MGDVDRKYLILLKEKLADIAVEAWEEAEPGSFETAWTEAPDLGHNRRVVDENGEADNIWVDAEGAHTGVFDLSVMLVATRRPDGSPKALLVNYGCHPVTLGPESLAISSDYAGHIGGRLRP